MHSPPSPKVHLDSVTLSAAAVGATSVLKDTNGATARASSSGGAGGVSGGTSAHHSGPKKAAIVDLHLISQQISELTNRVDTLESSMKSDIRTILEILQQQQQTSQVQQSSASRSAHPRLCAQPHPPVVPDRQMTNTYPTDSEYSSFDLAQGCHDKPPQHTSPGASLAGSGGCVSVGATGVSLKLPPTQQKQHSQPGHRGGNVQRSISQPECANERNLFT